MKALKITTLMPFLICNFISCMTAFSQWKDITPAALGQIHCLAEIKGSLCVSTGSGIYTYDKEEWKILNDDLAFKIKVYGDTVVYFKSNSAYYKLPYDSFEKVFDENVIADVAIYKDKFFICLDTCIYVYDLITKEGKLLNAAFKSLTGNDSLLFGLTKGGKIKTSQNGEEWNDLNNNFIKHQNINEIAVSPKGHILAAVDGKGLYRSLNNGDNWQSEFDYEQDQFCLRSTGTYAAAGFKGFLIYSKSGASWKTLLLPDTTENIYDIAVVNKESLVVLTSKNDKYSSQKVLIYENFTSSNENYLAEPVVQFYPEYISVTSPCSKAVNYSIIDLAGRVVNSGSISNPNFYIQKSSLNNGLYFLIICSAGNIYAYKILN